MAPGTRVGRHRPKPVQLGFFFEKEIKKNNDIVINSLVSELRGAQSTTACHVLLTTEKIEWKLGNGAANKRSRCPETNKKKEGIERKPRRGFPSLQGGKQQQQQQQPKNAMKQFRTSRTFMQSSRKPK